MARLAPAVVCVAALPPEGGPYARQLCHLLRGRAPEATLVAFRPGEPGIDPGPATRRLREAGADLVVATLAEASAALARLLAGDPGASGAAPARPRRPSYPAGVVFTFQISSAYCRMVRSEKNLPLRAVLSTAMRSQRSWSCQAVETSSWQAR